jgi:zinc resistance-associated protein
VKIVKAKTIIGLLVLGVLVAGMVYAAGDRGQYPNANCQNIDIEKVKKFQKETLSLRDELVTKRLELRNEYKKQSPDNERIATLRGEIRDLRSQIQAVADKYEVPLRCMKWRGKRMYEKPEGT